MHFLKSLEYGTKMKVRKFPLLKVVTGYLLVTILTLSTAYADLPVIKVEGNEETKTDFVVNLTKNCLENQNAESIPEIDSTAVKTCILNSQLFADASIELDSDSITVSIDERWTLIPVPIISSGSDGGTSIGVFLLEQNFLGRGKKLALGATTSETDGLLFFQYEDPSLFFSDWRMKINFGTQKSQFDLYDGDEKIDGIKNNATFFNAFLGYKLHKDLTGSLVYQSVIVRHESYDDNVRPKDFAADSYGIELVLDKSDFKFYFQEGLRGELSFMKQFQRDDKDDLVTSGNLNLKWEFLTFSDQALQLSMEAGGADKADRRTAIRLGGKTGTRGIPDKGAWAESYGFLSADYQIPLMSGDDGTWTVAPFLDCGSINSIADDPSRVTYTSYGVGTYYFLKQVAIPGIGVILGQNNTYQGGFFSVTIGFNI